MKNLKLLIRLLTVFTILLWAFSCSSKDLNSDNTDSKPTNLSISSLKVGVDNNNPNGDGSGITNFTITATNATSYNVLINDELLKLTNNTFSYTFTKGGTNEYSVIVSAYNENGFTSATYSLTIFVSVDITLVWSDEFDIDGAPDPNNWTYDLGDHGWGNNELQNYTNNSENVIVKNGVLKIIAKANGTGYTSARIKSQGLQAFKYGKIEVRAKLPITQGTWPAIWMLGSNFNSVGWPHCGEIDIMEQKGWEKNKVLGTFHWQDNVSDSYAGYGIETEASTSTSEFHLYSLDWRADVIQVLYDDVPYVTFTNNNNLPFNSDFFFILNIAMGGNLGGDVDTNFTQDSMEIDYVRVYQ
ncbi:family 16 glycosylhydrolase [Polaribacter sp. Asnod1-A03]|uniref:glycoside hydrolase family 16 protein n=1 Tax=Polaribacter sp. Asnod1-A03 TaxID=3160581 RepID=UPI00386E8C66